jgi:hypothetical protein
MFYPFTAVQQSQLQISSPNIGGIDFLVISTDEFNGIIFYDKRADTYFIALERQVKNMKKPFDKKLSWPLCQVAKA